MNMQELQTALDRSDNWWDDLYGQDQEDAGLILDAARMWLNAPPEALKMLDGYPDLYEFSPKQVEALETLGVKMFPVKNEYIVQNVLDGLAALTPRDTDE